MTHLRATRKVLAYLPKPSDSAAEPDTALGDWYVNRIVLRRMPLLILVSERSMLPIVIRARDVRTLPDRLSDLVASRLRRVEGVSAQMADAEAAAMRPVVVGKTVNRSVLGALMDFKRLLSGYVWLDPMDDAALPLMEQSLEEVPWFIAGKRMEDAIQPTRFTGRLLRERWGG